MNNRPMSRRRFLQGALAGAGVGLLAACGNPPQATVAPTADAGAGAAAGAAATSAPAPTAAPVTDAAAGYLPSPMDGVPAAYTSFPKTFAKTVATPPGSGSSIRTLQFVYQPPVPPRAENAYWQALEKRLNETVNADLTPSDTFNEKFSTVLASGDLPDVITINPHYDNTHLNAVKQGAFTDLTPFLTGDALKEYPNLAAFPPYLWESIKVDGKIMGVPRETGRVSSVLIFRQDWAEKIGNPQPKNAQELFDLLVAFSKSDPDGSGKPDTYGLAGYQYAAPWLKFVFRVPNTWRTNDDGTLTNEIETDAFKQMLEWMRKLNEAGGYHPDAPNIKHKEEFVAGKIGAYNDGIGALPGTANMRARTKAVNPNAKVIGLVPPGFDGDKAVTHNSRGYWGAAAISATAGANAERVKELLRLLNYYAAPYGSEEWLFMKYGEEGKQHTVNPDGTRSLTDEGKKEIGDLNYLAFPPIVLSYDIPGDAEDQQQLFKAYVALGINNPVQAHSSATEADKGGELGTLISDTLSDVVAGRQPLSAWDTMVKDWKARGGDKIREEYQQQLAKK